MTRPMYESDADLKREARALDAFCNALGLVWEKCPMRDPGDHVPDARLYRVGEAIPFAYAEVKCRTNRRDAYPTLLISKAKIDAIHEKAPGYLFYLIVQWSDQTSPQWLRIGPAFCRKVSARKGGRIDRGDRLDIETCYRIPVNLFGRSCSE